MDLILGSLAILLACLGLIWAALQIQTTNRTIAQAWPDWEGIKSPLPFWLLLGGALLLAAGAGVLAFQAPKGGEPKSQAPAGDADQILALETEIVELKELLSEATKPSIIKTPAEAPTVVPPTEKEPSPSESPETVRTVETSPPETQKSALPTTTSAPPQIEALSEAVIESLVSGSVKPLEPIAHQSLLDQFTINPFNFSQLQYGLKFRLEEGYTPIYLTSLRSATGVTYVWKLQTVKSGPDILERLATAGGKVTGFRFDGLQ